MPISSSKCTRIAYISRTNSKFLLGGGEIDYSSSISRLNQVFNTRIKPNDSSIRPIFAGILGPIERFLSFVEEFLFPPGIFSFCAENKHISA